MAMKFRKKTLLAKIESVYGTDPTPTGAANAIQTKDLEIMPLEGESLTLGLDKDSLGADNGAMVGKHVKLTFKVPVAGAGAAGTAPAYGPLLVACGHEETIDPGVDVTYVPIDDAASICLKFKHDKVYHTILGARGKVKMTTAERQFAWYEFEFIGLYSAPVHHDTSLSPVLTAFQAPVPFRAANVEFDLLGETVCMRSLTFDCGQTNQFFECSSGESIELDNREAAFDTKFVEPLISDHSFFDDVSDEVIGELSYVHGTVAGNIVEFVAPNSQITKIARENQQGNMVLATSGPMARVDGVEYSIVVR
jgi:hypothetical protein